MAMPVIGFQKDLGDFLGSFSVSEYIFGESGWNLMLFDVGENLRPLGGGQDVTACFHGFNPFGLGAESEARDFEEIGFLLDPTGIGQDHAGVLLQDEHIEVANRGDYLEFAFIPCNKAV